MESSAQAAPAIPHKNFYQAFNNIILTSGWYEYFNANSASGN
jgi:hypothetical protein